MNLQSKKIHLASYLKNNGNYTRSELTKLISEQRVLVNNQIKPLSYVVLDGDIVTVDNQIIQKKSLVYYLYNKPIGIVCTNNQSIKDNIISSLNLEQRVFTVGRLDKDSHGLIILTNDGDFSNSLINSAANIEKEYIVTVLKPITEEFMINIKKPILLREKLTKEVIVNYIDEYHFKIVLTEGKYRQIRRMVINSKNRVVDLYRIRIGQYQIDNLLEGQIKEFKYSR